MCGSGIEHQTFFGRRLDQRQGFFPKRTPGITTSIFRCRACGLIYANPIPIPQRLEDHYDIAPEEYCDWAFEVPDFSRQIGAFTRLGGRFPRSSSALDIGAGAGRSMIALMRAGFDAHGIEPSPAFRRAAIERMEIPEERLRLISVE